MTDTARFAEENESELREILKDLCLIPAPSHHEEKRAAYCKKRLEKYGASGVYIDEALNVVFPINCGTSDRITVIAAHTDTVFPDTEPMPYTEDAEKIHSPGVGDDTVCVADLLLCAKYFIENDLRPQNGILFVCNSCEEGLGNLKGTRFIFEKYAGRIARFISFDASESRLYDRCVGSTRYRVSAATEGGHSFSCFGNKNAIVALAGIIEKIYAIQPPREEGCRTTYNVGVIEGGTSVNTIAQNASMLCEYRSDDPVHLRYMKEQFERIFADADIDGVSITVETVGERPCAVIDAEIQDAFAEHCLACIESVRGERPGRYAASTDCNIPLSLGIPAVCVGTYVGGGGHTREEWIRKDSILPGLRIALAVAAEIACGESAS